MEDSPFRPDYEPRREDRAPTSGNITGLTVWAAVALGLVIALAYCFFEFPQANLEGRWEIAIVGLVLALLLLFCVCSIRHDWRQMRESKVDEISPRPEDDWTQ